MLRTVSGGVIAFGSSVRARRLAWSVCNMKKESAKTLEKGLRREYDLARLKGGVRGKYYRLASAGSNLVLIEPDLAGLFPNSEAVNRALRLLADTARAAAGSKRAGKA